MKSANSTKMSIGKPRMNLKDITFVQKLDLKIAKLPHL